MRLEVRRYEQLAGMLSTVSGADVEFAYDPDYAADDSVPAISLSLPKRVEAYAAAEALPFFEGLLPEGNARDEVARYLHVSRSSPMRLLRALGSECAGVISIVDPDVEDATEPERPWYRPIEPAELAKILRNESGAAVRIVAEGRLSLAGAWNKVPLYRSVPEGVEADGWFVPMSHAASSHIVKVFDARYPDIALNEAFCMRLARACGIDAPDVAIIDIGVPIFVAARYDRVRGESGLRRLAQEDFCQALGVRSADKYESDGGPGIANMFRLVRESFTEPAVSQRQLLERVVFNYAIGNCDAHAKNFSILYRGGKVTLAPAYDLVSTCVYDGLTTRMAMRIGSASDINRVCQEDLLAMAGTAGISRRLLETVVEETTGSLRAVLPEQVDAFIQEHTGAQMPDLVGRIASGISVRLARIG